MPKSKRTNRSLSSSAIRRGRARPTVTKSRSFSVAVWGVLLAAGGLATWASVPHRDDPVASVWTTSATSAGAAKQMLSDVRVLGRDSPALLRLEWPGHPNAEEYRIQFRVDGRPGPRPLAIPSPVFLYDLESDVLRLPDEFDWAVAAVLPDGTEVVSPWQHHSAP